MMPTNSLVLIDLRNGPRFDATGGNVATDDISCHTNDSHKLPCVSSRLAVQMLNAHFIELQMQTLRKWRGQHLKKSVSSILLSGL